MRHYYRLYVKGFPKPVGYVHHSVVVEMPWTECWTYDSKDNSLIFDGGDDIQKRNEEMKITMMLASTKARNQREADIPLGPLRELSWQRTPVYSHDGQHIMDVDNAAAELLGVTKYTVALTAWTSVNGRRRYWVPQRSIERPSSPGKFDNLASASLGPEEVPLELMKQAADIQAWLPTEYTNASLRACGTISYHTWRHKVPFLATVQPHIQYVYEIELGKEMRPAAAGVEVTQLWPMSFDRILELLESGGFEPHAQMTYLAHFVRHGVADAENEPWLREVQRRLHRNIEFEDV